MPRCWVRQLMQDFDIDEKIREDEVVLQRFAPRLAYLSSKTLQTDPQARECP